MPYRSVGTRCAVCFEELKLPISTEQCLAILAAHSFVVVDIDCVAVARDCIATSQYRRGARMYEAPPIFDCSSFVKWVYGQKGIWLPRRSIQQRACGERVHEESMRAGDLVFTTGLANYYHDDPTDGVGHVGIATEHRTVIHAASERMGVIESSFEGFTAKGSLRGIRRYVPDAHRLYTLVTPLAREVEWSDDIRWLILQNV